VGIPKKESTYIFSSDNQKKVMERMQWEETPRLGVTKGIMLRMLDSFPRTTRKGYGKDIKGRNFSVSPTPRARKNRQSPGIDWSHLRIKQQSETEWKHFFIKLLQRWSSYINIHPTPPLEGLERVMVGMLREESARILSSDNLKGSWKGFNGNKPLGWGFLKGRGLESARFLSSDNPKGSWKGYKGLKPPGWGFSKDKTKDIQKRIRPNPFLGQPERVMERIQRVETSQLGVSKG
jgi:hypothetical protein